MAKQSALFKFRDEFIAFLPAHGVPTAWPNYVAWMNRAAKQLGRVLGPEELANEEDIQRLINELILVDGKLPVPKYSLDSAEGRIYVSNQRSTFRKYTQMVQSNFRGLFLSVQGAPAPLASDLGEPGTPASITQTIHRRIRDTAVSRQVKRLYEFRCQICGERLEIEPGVFYAEAHHLKPLGGEHKGPDVEGNLICLCPNHHALFDYFAVPLNVGKLALSKHALRAGFVEYHNARVPKAAKGAATAG